MYSEKDILSRLQAGESTERIANEMADALNNAIAEYEKQAKEQKNQEQKRKDAEALAKAYEDYAKKYYPEFKDLTFSAEEMDTMFEKSAKLINMLDEIKKAIDKKEKKDTAKTADDVLGDFLKHMKF